MYHTVRTVLNANQKIIEAGKIDNSNTQTYDRSHSLINTGTSRKNQAD